MKKSFTGEYRSVTANKANNSVPVTNPSIIAEVIKLTEYKLRSSSSCNSGNTALPANHSEVQANWDITMTGNILRGGRCSRFIFLQYKKMKAGLRIICK